MLEPHKEIARLCEAKLEPREDIAASWVLSTCLIDIDIQMRWIPLLTGHESQSNHTTKFLVLEEEKHGKTFFVYISQNLVHCLVFTFFALISQNTLKLKVRSKCMGRIQIP